MCERECVRVLLSVGASWVGFGYDKEKGQAREKQMRGWKEVRETDERVERSKRDKLCSLYFGKVLCICVSLVGLEV